MNGQTSTSSPTTRIRALSAEIGLVLFTNSAKAYVKHRIFSYQYGATDGSLELALI